MQYIKKIVEEKNETSTQEIYQTLHESFNTNPSLEGLITCAENHIKQELPPKNTGQSRGLIYSEVPTKNHPTASCAAIAQSENRTNSADPAGQNGTCMPG